MCPLQSSLRHLRHCLQCLPVLPQRAGSLRRFLSEQLPPRLQKRVGGMHLMQQRLSGVQLLEMHDLPALRLPLPRHLRDGLFGLLRPPHHRQQLLHQLLESPPVPAVQFIARSRLHLLPLRLPLRCLQWGMPQPMSRLLPGRQRAGLPANSRVCSGADSALPVEQTQTPPVFVPHHFGGYFTGLGALRPQKIFLHLPPGLSADAVLPHGLSHPHLLPLLYFLPLPRRVHPPAQRTSPSRARRLLSHQIHAHAVLHRICGRLLLSRGFEVQGMEGRQSEGLPFHGHPHSSFGAEGTQTIL
jgi:hypothetical protein